MVELYCEVTIGYNPTRRPRSLPTLRSLAMLRSLDPFACSAANRHFWRLSALRAHTKAPYKPDSLWKTLRSLKRPGRVRTEPFACSAGLLSSSARVDLGSAGSRGQGGQTDNKVGRWPPNCTHKNRMDGGKKMRRGVRNPLDPPCLRSPGVDVGSEPSEPSRASPSLPPDSSLGVDVGVILAGPVYFVWRITHDMYRVGSE